MTWSFSLNQGEQPVELGTCSFHTKQTFVQGITHSSFPAGIAAVYVWISTPERSPAQPPHIHTFLPEPLCHVLSCAECTEVQSFGKPQLLLWGDHASEHPQLRHPYACSTWALCSCMSGSLSGLKFCLRCPQRISVQEKCLHPDATWKRHTCSNAKHRLWRVRVPLLLWGWKGLCSTRSFVQQSKQSGHHLLRSPPAPGNCTLCPRLGPDLSKPLPGLVLFLPSHRLVRKWNLSCRGVGERSRVSRWEEQAKCSLSITLQCASFTNLLTVLESWWHFSKHWQK